MHLTEDALIKKVICNLIISDSDSPSMHVSNLINISSWQNVLWWQFWITNLDILITNFLNVYNNFFIKPQLSMNDIWCKFEKKKITVWPSRTSLKKPNYFGHHGHWL